MRIKSKTPQATGHQILQRSKQVPLALRTVARGNKIRGAGISRLRVRMTKPLTHEPDLDNASVGT